MRLLKFWPVLFILLYIGLVFRPFIFSGRLPIPADTIVGLYYPWRDYFLDQYPNGIPFKNALITDAVRQQYPWRQLAIDQLKSGQLPLWNPFSFSGYPLLANIQSAPFYPLNFLYWLGSFPVIWSLQILLQSVLGMMFMYLFLRNLKLGTLTAIFGSLLWGGSGFFVAWLESNNVVQAAIWLPLILLAVDKLSSKSKDSLWTPVFVFGIVSAFLAGHLQVSFYVGLTAAAYIFTRTFMAGKYKSLWLIAAGLGMALLLLSPWIIAVGQFLLLSARNVDQATWQKPDWFLPWQNLVQFIAPDFFGNPATGNYSGIWNYGEFVGYIGVAGLFFALIALISRKRETFFFGTLLVISFALALPNALAKVPFQLQIPFLASGQPSRLMVLIDFSLAVLAAFGLEEFLKTKVRSKALWLVVTLLGIGYAVAWSVAWKWQLNVSLRNLVLPTVLFGATVILSFALRYFPKKNLIIILVIFLSIFDLSRFATKFLSFSDPGWLYPQTKSITYLQNEAKNSVFRIGSTDDRVMAQNYLTVFGLQNIGGYDPLYLARYGEFIIAMERNRPDISPPFNFNRIISPQDYKSRLYDFLGVKYVLSYYSLFSPKLNLIYSEGMTKIYENSQVFPRAFFVNRVLVAANKQDDINLIFSQDFNLASMATAENYSGPYDFSPGKVALQKYSPNEIILQTDNLGQGFLVLTDAYYPTWKASIDNISAEIFLTDYAFRGVKIPAGKHLVRFFL